MEEWRQAANEERDKYYKVALKYTETDMLEDSNGEPKRWVGRQTLGEGCFGQAHLYVQLDRYFGIVNRVVAKDCDLRMPKAKGLWKSEDLWTTDTTDSDAEKVPKEVKAIYDLRGKQGSEYVVRILNWRIAEKERFYRLHLEVSQQSHRIVLVN